MGIGLTQLCRKQPQLEDLITEITTSQTDISTRLRSIERIKAKPIFHKISPVRFNSIEIEGEGADGSINRRSAPDDVETPTSLLPQSSSLREVELKSLEDILIEE
jgi:hypothetical protein